MLTASSKELYKKASYLNSWESEQISERFSSPKKQRYELRYNFRMSEMSAALGISQFSKLPKFLLRRRKLAELYTGKLSRLEGILVPAVDKHENLFFRYLVFLKNRNVIEVLKLYAQAGIEAGRGVCPALHRYLRKDPAHFVGAEKAMGGALSIPLYPALSDEEVERILRTTEKVLKS